MVICGKMLPAVKRSSPGCDPQGQGSLPGASSACRMTAATLRLEGHQQHELAGNGQRPHVRLHIPGQGLFLA